MAGRETTVYGERVELVRTPGAGTEGFLREGIGCCLFAWDVGVEDPPL